MEQHIGNKAVINCCEKCVEKRVALIGLHEVVKIKSVNVEFGTKQ